MLKVIWNNIKEVGLAYDVWFMYTQRIASKNTVNVNPLDHGKRMVKSTCCFVR